MKHTLTQKILIGISIVVIVFSTVQVRPKTAHAILGAGDTVIINADTSPTGISNTVNLWMQRIKEYVLDGLAWHIAKIMVQQITASTVQWINSGFSGSPSFLTNPEGYFANVSTVFTIQSRHSSGTCTQPSRVYKIRSVYLYSELDH